MSDPFATRVRQAATVFGIAGLVPFVLLAAGTWLDSGVLAGLLGGVLVGANQAAVGLLQHMLSVYAVAILSFVGALHWGFVLAAPRRMIGSPVLALGWSILPALYGWVVVAMIDLPRAFAWLAAGFAVAFVTDVILYPRYYAIPPWFIRLRLLLTLLAGGSLAGAALAP